VIELLLVVAGTLAGCAAGLWAAGLRQSRRGMLARTDVRAAPGRSGQGTPHLESVLRAGSIGALAVDRQLRVCFVNEVALSLLEVAAKSAVPWTMVAMLRDHQTCEAVTASMADGEPRSAMFSSPSGRRDLEASIAAVGETDNWAAVVVLRDVTEQKRTAAVRRDFVSNVSHDLRTPLASIKAVVDVLITGVDDPATEREFLQGIDDEIDRMTRLVEELMQLARIEAGEARVHMETVDVRALIEDAARRLSPQAERKRLLLEVETGPPLPPTKADGQRLGGAVINLIQNAINFTPDGGRILVRAVPLSDEVRVEVQDTGIGIAVQETDRVFERFYKVDRSRGSSGSGLGLALVKHTVEAHGGRVGVRSRLGSGSTFWFSLPVPKAEQSADTAG
jgi:two-component system phosphate regulon sensor histidine kinase PhoR